MVKECTHKNGAAGVSIKTGRSLYTTCKIKNCFNYTHFYIGRPMYTHIHTQGMCVCVYVSGPIFFFFLLLHDKSGGYCSFYLPAYSKPCAELFLKVTYGQYCIMQQETLLCC